MRTPSTSASVLIDPTTLAGPPLSKERIAVYNSGLVPFERYERDVDYIAAVRPESVRIDLGWGAAWMPWTREVVHARQDGFLEFDFEETDRLARLLDDAGTRPYWSYCYVPQAAREPLDDWRTMARDDSTWVSTVRAYVEGLGARGVRVGYHEVYNEPDLRDERTGDATFYTGGLEDYLDLYSATATAIRDAAPGARVGGPALAVAAANAHWLDAFFRLVTRENLPLDFVSFHHYGHFGLESTLKTVRDVLAGFPALHGVELHLNEYNAFAIDYPRGGLQDSHLLASAFAADIPRLLAHRDLTRTHWAQFLDSGGGNFSGMIDIDGVPKPIYAVYRFYQDMPVDRARVAVEGPPGFGGIAGTAPGHAAAILWNRHFADLAIDLELTRVGGGVTLTLIDADGVGQEQVVPIRGGRATIALPAGAVALLRVGDQPVRSTDRVAWAVQTTAHGTGWSDVDEASVAFRFGVSRPGWNALAADLADEVALDGWDVQARTAQGQPVPATVAVRVTTCDQVEETIAAGDATPDWSRVVPVRRPAEGRQVVVAVAAPPGTYVTATPRSRV